MISPNAFSNGILLKRKGAQDMSGSSASAATVVASSSKGSTHLPNTKPSAAKVPTNTCNDETSKDPSSVALQIASDTLCAKNQLPGNYHDRIVRYSPYPPFAPLPPPTNATIALSSCPSSVTDKTPKPSTSTTNTYCQDFVSTYLRNGSTNMGTHTSSTATSSVGTTNTETTTTTHSTFKTITPMAGAGTKTYVINELGKLTCTPGSKMSRKITTAALDTPERPGIGSSRDNVGTNQDADDDDLYVVDTEDDDNASVSSLNISRHTQTIADALTCAGISTTIVVSGGHPKCLFVDGASSAGNGCDPDLVIAKPPSGCRGLLARFNEADADPPISSRECRFSSPASLSNSSACSSSSTCSGTGSSVSTVPCDDDGLNLGNEMNLERKVDTVKWKRRANEKNRRSKKKRRRLTR